MGSDSQWAVTVGGGGGGDAGGDGGDGCGRWTTVRGSKDMKLAFFTSSLFFCALVPFEWRIAGFGLTVCFPSRFACFDLLEMFFFVNNLLEMFVI